MRKMKWNVGMPECRKSKGLFGFVQETFLSHGDTEKTARKHSLYLFSVPPCERLLGNLFMKIQTAFKFFRYSIVSLFLILLSSCENDFDAPERDAAKRMVLNCRFTDAWQMSVYLTESYTTTGSNNINSLEGAKVELFEDGVFKEELAYVPSDTGNTFGSYRSALIAQEGKKYMVKATHPLYGTVTAEDEMPLAAQILSYSLLHYPDSSAGDRNALVKFRFRDDGSKNDYYRVNVWMEARWNTVNSTGDTLEHSYIYGFRPELLTTVADTVRDGGWFLLFSDRSFNGQDKELQMEFRYVPEPEEYSSVRLWVELYTVSKAHYEYYRTLQIEGNFNGPSEPVHVFSNVQNGYGIFAAENFERMEFVVK